MKKIIAVFLALLITVSFCSCGKADSMQMPKDEGSTAAGITENYIGQKDEGTAQNDGEEKTDDASKADSNPNPTENSTAETRKPISNSETGSTPTVVSTEPSTQPAAKTVCTVQVECKKILGKKNKFKKDASLIPADGVIISPVKVYLDDGATAYDALKKACNENSVALNAQKSSFGGVYVVGIGGIEEKDCGAQSGWTYTVNGQSPSTGLSNYKIKNGDSLVLSYVC